MYYTTEFSCETYDDRDTAIEEMMERFDDDEIINRCLMCRPHDILNELRRLDSPLFWEMLEEATNEFINDYLMEHEGEEEEFEFDPTPSSPEGEFRFNKED